MSGGSDAYEQELERLGLPLPEAGAFNGTYIRPVQFERILFMPGHSGWRLHNHRGKLGRDLTVEQGQEAAKYAVVACLAAVKRHIDDLDNVDRILKVTGFINATEDFSEGGEVLNGASEVLYSLWGDRGQHARSAICVASLNDGWPLEIEVILAVKQA